jgi:hypothetical protein
MKRFRTVVSGAIIRRVACSCAAIALAGCSYTQPYVKKDVTGDAAPAGDPMPLTRQAISRLDKWVVEVDKSHDRASDWRRGMNLLTFGLVSATGISALRSKSVNQTRNLAIGSGVAYTGTSLFLPSDQITLYNSANTALLCIQGRVSSLYSSVASQSAQLAMALPAQYKDAVYTAGTCPIDAATQAHVDAAEAARQGAIAAVGQARAADPSVSRKAESAGLNVIHTLNTQMDVLSPSLDAILAAAKSSVAVANGLVAAPPAAATATATPKPAAIAAVCRPVPAEEVDKLRIRLSALQTSYEAVQTTMAQQLNAVAALDTACTLAPLQLAPVALSQSEITVTKDTNFNVVVTGGTGTYFWNAIGDAIPADIVVNLAPGGTLMLIGKATVAAGKSYTLSIRDSSAAPKPVLLKITTK